MPHGLDDARKLVGSDVGMGIHEDVGVGPVFYKPTECLVPIPPLLGPCVQFAIRIGPGAPFPETIVGFRIDPALPDEGHQVPTALPDGLAPFDHHRLQPQLDQAKRTEQAGRTGAHDDDFGCIPHRLPVALDPGDRIQAEAHPQLHGGGMAAGIQAPTQDNPVTRIAHLLPQGTLNGLPIPRPSRRQAE